MSEQQIEESLPPKPFSTAGYLFLTTFWTALIPGLLVSLPVSFGCCGAILEGYFVLSGISIFVSILLFYLLYLNAKFNERLIKNVRVDNIPSSFFLRYLPFYLPLFYVMALTAAAFGFASLFGFDTLVPAIFAFGVADYRNYGNSIGFSFRYYVEGMFKHDGVKLLKVNGIEPTAANIQSGKYPFIGELVMITDERENPNPNRTLELTEHIPQAGTLSSVTVMEQSVTIWAMRVLSMMFLNVECSIPIFGEEWAQSQMVHRTR
ncbi:MAG: hypothetical protein LBU65_07065 [Planctomycetaceae bacterium]|jgi:hypothetical protein|nr:hypothetical protein [Planctomycetaceae bacterium]